MQCLKLAGWLIFALQTLSHQLLQSFTVSLSSSFGSSLQGFICLPLTQSPTASTVTPAVSMSSFRTATEILWGLPLVLFPDNSISNILCPIFSLFSTTHVQTSSTSLSILLQSQWKSQYFVSLQPSFEEIFFSLKRNLFSLVLSSTFLQMSGS